MKDGQAVETGTHKELMALKGEYSELYNVQAQAFSEDSL
jgi:ABC-type multidrug transport system fused ATPase/permease subunit